MILAVVLAASLAVPAASAAPIPTRLTYARGEIVPIPASVPHEEGDMIDREVFPVSFEGVARQPTPRRHTPPGGISTVRSGGISPHGD